MSRLLTALRDAEAPVSDPVVKLYGEEVTSRVRREHLLGLLWLDLFDMAEGFNPCALVLRSG